jgi:Tfp pilus assembly protein PilX
VTTSGQRGVSLLIVLIMLVVIGLTSAASLRSASSNERISNNFRMHALAEQYAEAALRYCETQLSLADGARVDSLKDISLTAFTGTDYPAWANPLTWTGTGGASASLTRVPEALVTSADSAFKPVHLPQCAVEILSIPLTQNGEPAGAANAYVITARGFSTDYSASPQGASLTGSVVWLQSVVSVRRGAAAEAGALADRVWRRIINPPVS